MYRQNIQLNTKTVGLFNYIPLYSYLCSRSTCLYLLSADTGSGAERQHTAGCSHSGSLSPAAHPPASQSDWLLSWQSAGSSYQEMMINERLFVVFASYCVLGCRNDWLWKNASLCYWNFKEWTLSHVCSSDRSRLTHILWRNGSS